MNKKLLAILLAAVMLLALAACGDEPAPTPTPDPDPVDTPNEGGEDAQSVLTMFTFMDMPLPNSSTLPGPLSAAALMAK